MENGRERHLKSAGTCLAAALAQTDLKTMAALLRAAARYLEGASGQAEAVTLVAMPIARR